MKTICFIVVYIGKLPSYFDLWLASCQDNITVDFYMVTDQEKPAELPQNVYWVNTDFDNVKRRFQCIFDFPISLGKPYKLCDYKVVYGEAFPEISQKYDFWGYCDIDLVWGDIRKFLTDDIFDKYERVLTRGHCSLFKSDSKVSSYYRTLSAKGCQNFKDVFTTNKNRAFDEWAAHKGWGLSEILKRNGISQYDERVFADLYFLDYQLNPVGEEKGKRVFYYSNGVLESVERNGNDIETKEYMYVHFQKRPLKPVRGSLGGYCNLRYFAITPPSDVIKYEREHSLTSREVCALTKRNQIYSMPIKFRIQQIKNKASELIFRR